MAEGAYNQKEYSTAKINVSKGLGVSPDHERLLSLKTSLDNLQVSQKHEIIEDFESGVKRLGEGVESAV